MGGCRTTIVQRDADERTNPHSYSPGSLPANQDLNVPQAQLRRVSQITSTCKGAMHTYKAWS